MKTVKIPMSATRAVRLAKLGKDSGKTIAFLLAEGLKNLTETKRSFGRKV